MLPQFSKIKGIHPGVILMRELKNLKLKSKELANSVNEHTQTISAILNERRGINPVLSIKLGREFGVDEDYFMLLQASHDVKKKISIQNKAKEKPNLKNIREALFWDTDFHALDWSKNKKAIIKRIFERGNALEINEIIAFYGEKTVESYVRNIKNDFLPSYKENVDKFFDSQH